MNHQEYLLIQTASECNEVAHAITKFLQFGPHSVEPGKSDNNRVRLEEEVTDLLATLEMLQEARLITVNKSDEAFAAKKEKVRKHMEIAKYLETLS